jgi:coenzyme PQQ precursor peptide PqqA
MDQLRTDTWTRPDFEEIGSAMEIAAYTNDWDSV